jgi:membrane fusion protein, multidrug efflux system
MNAGIQHGVVDAPTRRGLGRWRWVLILAGPVLIAVVVAAIVLTSGRFQTTEDAYVQIAKAPVAPSISGRVVEVYVRENQAVRRGQVLFRLDASELETNVSAAAAQVANERLQVGGLRAAFRQQAANVQVARETLAFASREAVRQRQLVTVGVNSQQQADQAAHAALVAREQLAATEQAAAQALAALGGDPNLTPDAAPAVMQAQAQLDRAKLNLSHTSVLAPADGIVARVQQMPVGTYLNASQTAFWLLSGAPWVEANFKEDQLAKMRVGQPVDIDIDARPEVTLKGRVASFSPGTGAAFSALPAQNSTGNWVKVAQRLPVRIEFARPPGDLAAGLSARVKVDVRVAPEKPANAAGR